MRRKLGYAYFNAAISCQRCLAEQLFFRVGW
jgi:hypothetical protein